MRPEKDLPGTADSRHGLESLRRQRFGWIEITVGGPAADRPFDFILREAVIVRGKQVAAQVAGVPDVPELELRTFGNGEHGTGGSEFGTSVVFGINHVTDIPGVVFSLENGMYGAVISRPPYGVGTGKPVADIQAAVGIDYAGGKRYLAGIR